MSEEEPKTFDEDYVKSLREEAKSYRQELADLKERHNKTQIETELVRRGVKADPDWVKLAEGQTPTEAVDKFLESHADILKVSEEEPEPKKKAPKSLPRNTYNPSTGPSAKGSFGSRSLDEIEADPTARQNLGDLYRSLLARSSNLD